MALVTKEFKLDLAPGQLRPVVNASQGDIGRPFKADLFWNGSPWTATGYTAKIRGKKPDKTVFDYTATVDGSTVTFATTEQMTIISGPVECELVFTSGDDVVASANFVLMVEDSPYNPDAPSESVIPGIEDIVTDVVDDVIGDNVGDWLDEHPEATTTVQDGAITKAKINTAFLPEIENAYVTPEMFGAKGDGTTDDTAAWIAALETGKDVYGANTYLVGTGHTGATNVLTIAHPCTIKAKLIDNRAFSTTNNLRNWGLFGLESDNVNLDIEVIGNNNLPVDDENANNLSDVAGYAIVGSKTEPISNCNINLTVENVNGFGWAKTVKDSIVRINAKHSAYPWANWYGVGCTIILNCEEVHRTFWGALESSTAFVYCKDFVSTGNSGHFLLTNYADDDNIEHLGDNVKIYIYDTGTTHFNAGSSYFMVNTQTETTATINAEVWVSGDIDDTTYNQSAFTINHNATINGSLVIHDDLKKVSQEPSRMLGMLDNLIVYANVKNHNYYYQPGETNNGTLTIYGDASVYLKNLAGDGYFYGLEIVSAGSPEDSASVTGTIHAYSCKQLRDFTNATVYNYNFPTTHLYDPVITQKAGETLQLCGVCTGIGLSSTLASIVIPLPFYNNQNYTVEVSQLGITNVIGSAQGAQFITNIYKYDNSIMLYYENANTPITSGRAYQCNYTLTITFT